MECVGLACGVANWWVIFVSIGMMIIALLLVTLLTRTLRKVDKVLDKYEKRKHGKV